MTLHDGLLETLQGTAEVRLVASLKDPRMNFPDPDQLHVFIPDIHLITPRRAREGGFKFTSNCLPLLETVLRALAKFKSGAVPGGRVVVYQIGDLFDLWRQTPRHDPDVDVAASIQDNYPKLIEALFDSKLDAQFLLGNHDYDLFQWVDFAAWQRYFFLSPSVMLLHGDVFDWVERLPDAVQQFFVALFAPHAQPERTALQRMRPFNEQMRGLVQNNPPRRSLGRCAPPDALSARFNVQVEGNADPKMLTFLTAAREMAAKTDRQFGTSLKVAIIGHTHHARIALHETELDWFTLIDCGAWIEECAAEDIEGALPNAQIAALGANEARIYQLIA